MALDTLGSLNNILPVGYTRPARVAKGTFIGIYWGGVVITAIFFAFRIYVRLKAFRRVYSDDLLVLAAWLMLLTSAIIWQFDKESLYEQMELTSGQLLPSAGFEHRVEKALRGSLVEIVFFYSSLWSVKVSFLIFFRRLGHKVKGQKQLWWFVLIVTLASYIVCLSLINYNCLASTSLSSLADCVNPDRIRLVQREIITTVVIDIVTDALIIMVPVSMLWKVQISVRQKLGLVGIFSITVFVIVFAIIRVALVVSYVNIPDQSWLYLWSAIEQTVAITVACLGSYRPLFMKPDRSRRLTDSEESSHAGPGQIPRLSTKGSGQTLGLRNIESHTSTVIHTRNDSRLQKSRSMESTEFFIPPNRVHVKKTIQTFISEDPGSRMLRF